MVYDQELDEFFCFQHFALARTCVTCYNGKLCDFENNPSPLPKQVQQTQRMGNAVMTQVVKNPERINITCKNGCACWSDELGCIKESCIQNRFCLNENWDLRRIEDE